MFDVIDRLKTEWTDKYVVIDSPAPELARFAAATGLVKTVNMNGRCLVQFDQYNNTGWYDIDPTCLKIVPKPVPKPAETKPKAAAPAKAPSPKPAAAAGKPSTADILAAARGKAATPAKPAGRPSTADILAAARGKKAAAVESPAPVETATAEPEAPAAEPVLAPVKAAAVGPLPKTTAEIIAWCRTRDSKG